MNKKNNGSKLISLQLVKDDIVAALMDIVGFFDEGKDELYSPAKLKKRFMKGVIRTTDIKTKVDTLVGDIMDVSGVDIEYIVFGVVEVSKDLWLFEAYFKMSTVKDVEDVKLLFEDAQLVKNPEYMVRFGKNTSRIKPIRDHYMKHMYYVVKGCYKKDGIRLTSKLKDEKWHTPSEFSVYVNDLRAKVAYDESVESGKLDSMKGKPEKPGNKRVKDNKNGKKD